MSEVKMNIEALSSALESGLSTSVYEIFVPSIKKKVSFKPLLTGQCKTMAKLLIEANQKPFDTFKAVVAMINVTCMDGIDMNELTELDRIKIMLEFYMNNNILKDFDMDCPECGCKNKIKINLEAIVNKLECIDITPTIFRNGQDNALTCTIEIPKLPVMHRFYELVQSGEADTEDITAAFISNLKLEFADKEVDPIEMSLDQFDTMEEYIEAIKIIPYIITVNKETNESVFDIIMGMLDNVMSDGEVDHKCTQCDHDFGEVASAQNFI